MSVDNVTNKNLSFHWNYIVNVLPEFGKCSISMREVITTTILKGFDQKNRFFEGQSWFSFNNLGQALGTNLKFYTSVAKG